MNSDHPDMSVVLPVYNEESCISAVLAELRDALRSAAVSYEIILVDDGSDDRTAELLHAFAAENPEAVVLRLSANSGQSAAFWAGIQRAAGRVISLMDADGQNDPADIEKCAAPVLAGDADICCGYRQNRKDTLSKRIASKLANRFRRKMLGDDIIDTGCSMKAFRAELLKVLQYWDGMHRFLPVLASLQGASIVQIPVNHRPRLAGKSKYTNFSRLRRSVRDLRGVKWLKSRTRKFQVQTKES